MSADPMRCKRSNSGRRRDPRLERIRRLLPKHWGFFGGITAIPVSGEDPRVLGANPFCHPPAPPSPTFDTRFPGQRGVIGTHSDECYRTHPECAYLLGQRDALRRLGLSDETTTQEPHR